MILLTILMMCLFQIPVIQAISCYSCINCDDPFNANSSNVNQTTPSCSYCYKLTVYMAYIPTQYVIKDCVQTCTESSGMFGGSSLEVNCCSSSLCNNALGIFNRSTSLWMICFVLLPRLLIENLIN